MKTKLFIVSALLSFIIAMSFGNDASAVDKRKLWMQKCASCHDGKTAPNADALVKKYKTVEELAEAVKTKGHKGMNMLKGDPNLIKMIAKELGIKKADKK